jgi:hypothetical protein
VLCAFFLTLTSAAGTVLWIAAEFFTGVVWIIAYVLPDYAELSRKCSVCTE